MVVQYNHDLLNDFVAPGITEFRNAEVRSHSDLLATTSQWMLVFGLQDVLGHKLKPLPARAFRQFVRRTVAALRAYEEMRLGVNLFLADQIVDSPKIGPYFRALDAAEVCLLQCQMALESLVKTKTVSGLSAAALPTPINNLANGIKHFGERTENGKSGNSLLPVWFEGSGITGAAGRVTFLTLHNLILDMANASHEMLGIEPTEPLTARTQSRTNSP